jgi:hypothetical protein
VLELDGAPAPTQILFQARVLAAGPAGEITPALKVPLQRYIVDLNIDPQGLV